MAKKLHKRVRLRYKKAIAKVRNRKNNPPVRGRKVSHEERNRPVIDRIMAKISSQ